MKLPEMGVRRPVLTAMVFIAFIVLGLVALSFLKLDQFPEIEIPTISISTVYQGAGPQEVESRVTEIIERQVATVPKVKNVESTSREGASNVTLRFDWGTDLDAASNDVRDKLGSAKRALPDEIEEPVINKFDLSMMPVLVVVATANESYPGLVKLLEDKVADPLMRLPGVASVYVRGGLTREIQVEVDKQKLESYGISLDRITSALSASNLDTPGGHVKQGYTDYLVRVPGNFVNMDEIADTVIGISTEGAPIYVKDVATIKDGYAEKTREVRVNGRQGVALIVQKQSGANTVEVVSLALKEIEELKKNLPSDVEMSVAMDGSKDIKQSVDTVSHSVIYGGILVILVLLLFLRNIRTSLIVAVSIPTSLIVTFLLMYLLGYTLNTVSLAALAIAIGMVVDDSIVVLENIYRHRERGERPSEGAIAAASEVGTAVVAATLTTIAIFLPIIFVGGIAGIMFKQLALVVSLAMAISLLTSLWLVPMLSAKFLKVDQKGHGLSHRISEFFGRGFEAVEKWYGGVLNWSLEHKKIVIGISVAIFFISLGMMSLVGVEFFPEEDPGMISIDVEMPVGTRLERTGEVLKAMENIFTLKVPEKSLMYSSWGYGGGRGGGGGDEGTHTGSLSVRFVDREFRNRSSSEIAEAIRDDITKQAGAKVFIATSDPFASMLYGGASFVLELRGYDLEQAGKLSNQIVDTLKDVKGLRDVRVNRSEGRPEIRIEVDRKKASSLGLNVYTIANMVQTAINGTVATPYREGGEEYDILVRLKESDRMGFEGVKDLFVTSPVSGKPIRLSNIARIYEEMGPTKIDRKDQERVVKITANIYGSDLGSVVAEAKERLKNIDLSDFEVVFSGAKAEQEESFNILTIAFLLGIVLVYMVMASQFESLRDPFIMLLAIPFAIVGVVWTMLLTGTTLSLISFIGIIMLLGIVVKNGIVLIDYINILRDRGMKVREAIVQGGKHRLRPVLMTALTTMLGLLPLALTSQEGSEFWNPIAQTVIGGLFVSTALTMIFAPTMYCAFEERKAKRKGEQRCARAVGAIR